MKEKILRNIAKNGKLSTEDLAAMLDSTPEEIEKEIKQMEEEGVICGYPTLISWDKTDCERDGTDRSEGNSGARARL